MFTTIRDGDPRNHTCIIDNIVDVLLIDKNVIHGEIRHVRIEAKKKPRNAPETAALERSYPATHNTWIPYPPQSRSLTKKARVEQAILVA